MWLSSLPLVRRLLVLREELCTLKLYYPNPRGGSLCGKSYVDDIVKILLYEGGNVEQWLEPRNNLVVCV